MRSGRVFLISRKQTLQTLTTNSQSKAQASNAMTQPHPHKDLIIAWANGAEIEFLLTEKIPQEWQSLKQPRWNLSTTYRIKSKAKTVHFALYYNGSSHTFSEELVKTNKLANVVAATFDNQGNLVTIEKVS